MHGLPANTDLDFFVGQRLIQVCFGRHEVQLNFDEGTRLSIESAIACVNVTGSEKRYQEVLSAGSFVAELLDGTIKSASGTSDGTLRLTFEDGRSLIVYDSNEAYESYVISHGDRTIAV